MEVEVLRPTVEAIAAAESSAPDAEFSAVPQGYVSGPRFLNYFLFCSPSGQRKKKDLNCSTFAD